MPDFRQFLASQGINPDRSGQTAISGPSSVPMSEATQPSSFGGGPRPAPGVGGYQPSGFAPHLQGPMPTYTPPDALPTQPAGQGQFSPPQRPHVPQTGGGTPGLPPVGYPGAGNPMSGGGQPSALDALRGAGFSRNLHQNLGGLGLGTGGGQPPYGIVALQAAMGAGQQAMQQRQQQMAAAQVPLAGGYSPPGGGVQHQVQMNPQGGQFSEYDQGRALGALLRQMRGGQ